MKMTREQFIEINSKWPDFIEFEDGTGSGMTWFKVTDLRDDTIVSAVYTTPESKYHKDGDFSDMEEMRASFSAKVEKLILRPAEELKPLTLDGKRLLEIVVKSDGMGGFIPA